MLSFNAAGELLGRFTEDPRIVDPRGLTLDPAGALIYLNSADRMLALDRSGRVVLDSGPMADLDPGGAVFGPDGRFYVTMRRRRTILGISASLEGDAEPLVPEGIVPFPRGFAFGHDGSLYLASGIGPSGEGDNTIVVFDPDAPAQPRPLVTDPELSPLDMTLAPNDHIVVASESPFGAPDAVVLMFRSYAAAACHAARTALVCSGVGRAAEPLEMRAAIRTRRSWVSMSSKAGSVLAGYQGSAWRRAAMRAGL